MRCTRSPRCRPSTRCGRASPRTTACWPPCANWASASPYSPLGRGFLTGAIRTPADFDADDYRRHSPRFQGDNFARNLALVEQVRALAAARGVTAGQLALAWVLARGEDLVPIPGTKRLAYLEENLGALDIVLDAADLARIEAVFPPAAAAGARYPAASIGSVHR